MTRKKGALIALIAVFALIAAACGDTAEETTTAPAETEAPATTAAPETTAPPETEAPEETMAEETTTTEEMVEAAAVKACLVTDLAGIDDRSFNANSWTGVEDAIAAGFATEDSFFLESDAAEDWQPNIDQMLAQDCEHIVTVGFALGEVTAINAEANPDVTWTIVDFAYPEEIPNVRELQYQTDEAAFMAGYLAAGMSQTGVVGTYGGANFPTVSIFMDGFTRGVEYYNEEKGTSVQVLGWDVEAADGVFTGSFTDMDLARSTAESLFDEGVDIIIPVGGAINLPAGDAIFDRGLDAALIGVDVDAFVAMDPPYQDLWMTTVEKNLAGFVSQSIQAHAEGNWTPGIVVGTLENDGVGLSDYHSWDDRIPDELKAEVEQLRQDIIDGTIPAATYVVTARA